MLTTNGRSFFFGNHQTFNLSNEVQVDQVSVSQVSSDQVPVSPVSSDQVSVDEVSADLTTGQMDEIDNSMHIGYDIAIQDEPFLSTLNQQRNPMRISKVMGKRFNPKYK